MLGGQTEDMDGTNHSGTIPSVLYNSQESLRVKEKRLSYEPARSVVVSKISLQNHERTKTS